MGTVTRFYSNNALDNTVGNAGGISSSATSVFCATTPAGYPQRFPWTLALDMATGSMELVNIVAGSGTAGTPWVIGQTVAGGASVLGRGWDGTIASSHSPGAPLGHRSSAGDLGDFRTHQVADSTSSTLPHGLPAAAWLTSALAVINETKLTNSTTAVVSWNSIPQVYSHLLVVVNARLTGTNVQDGDAVATINGDSAARYGWFEMGEGTESGSLTNPWSNTAFGQTAWAKFITLSASQAGSAVNAGGGYMLLLNYTSTALNKMAVGLSGFQNATGSAGVAKIRWCFYNPSSQTAVNSLSLAASAGFYGSGAFLGLYGIA